MHLLAKLSAAMHFVIHQCFCSGGRHLGTEVTFWLQNYSTNCNRGGIATYVAEGRIACLMSQLHPSQDILCDALRRASVYKTQRIAKVESEREEHDPYMQQI